MAKLSLADVLRFTGGTLLHSDETAADGRLVFSQVCTDSRSLSYGCLFVALRGERFDGHDFAAAALAGEAAAVLVDHPVEFAGHQVSGLQIVVKDTLQAYQALATGYRQQIGATVIAVTGSVGKTTTREMIAACLKPFLSLNTTKANLNNEIGLPQTLLSARPGDGLQIVELGMRAAGEIACLSQIAKPDVAVITGIGYSHIERLGSQEAIAAAKEEITAGLKTGGTLVLNADDPWLSQLAERYKDRFRIVGYSRNGRKAWPFAYAFATADRLDPQATQTGFTFTFTKPGSLALPLAGHLPCPGLHLIDSLLAGLALAFVFGYDLSLALKGTASFRNVGSRQRLLKVDGLTIMDDSYNASFESVQAALQTLSLLAAGTKRRIAVLGSMLELGRFSKSLHRQVGDLVAESGFDAIFALGRDASEIVAAALSRRPSLHGRSYDNQELLCRDLVAFLRPGDHVLVKGSRALQMEKVIDWLQQQKLEET